MRVLLTAAVSAAMLLVGACSAKQEPANDQPPAVTHGSLAECLKANGVDESSRPAAVLGPPAGVDPAAWDKAMKACATLGPGPAGP